jgi:transcriptional regulator with XRE-family HTH domain
MSLGENIREARLALSLSQEELGEKLGLAHQTVSKWERDESMPDASLLPALSDLLHVSLDRLFDRPAREYMDAAVAARHWLLTLKGAARWQGFLHLMQVLQTVLAGFWEHPFIAPTMKLENYEDPSGKGYTGYVVKEEGFTLSSSRPAFPWLLLFPEPAEGWGKLLKEDDPEYWSALGSEEVRRLLRRLYAGELPERFDRRWALEQLGTEKPEETLRALEKLGVLRRETVLLDGKETSLYRSATPLIPLTILLLSTVKKEQDTGFHSPRRGVPLLRKRENTESK